MWLLRKKAKENIRLKWLVVITFTSMVIVSVLATTLPINGQTTADISDSYPNLFAPAGITFSIWGLIYMLLAGYTVYQFASVRLKQSKLSETTLEKVNEYFATSSVLNISWILAWHYELLWLSVPIMIAILYCLFIIVTTLHGQKMTTRDRWLIRAPFSVYFAWITVASVAIITTFLVSTGWDGFGLRPAIWTVLVLLMTAGIALVATYRLRDWVYGSVIVWALLGILLKHLSTSGWNGMYPTIIIALTILITIQIVVVLNELEREYGTRN